MSKSDEKNTVSSGHIIPTYEGEQTEPGFGDDEKTSPYLVASSGETPLLLPGAQVARRYIVERGLKRGGMGSLFLVKDTLSGELYALKAVPHKTEKSTTAPARFRQEIEILLQLKHPHIVSMVDHGESATLRYYVMDYLPGGTLFERLEATGPMPPQEALTVAMNISRAIHYSHTHKLLHRDLKPENILFAADNRPVLIDFGVALMQDLDTRITQKGHIVGTPFYMPPERFIGGEELSTQSDVYGLGLLLYEMLVGFNPFAKEKPTNAIMRIAEGRLPPLRQHNPNLSVALEELVTKATTRDLTQRYKTAREFTNACTKILRSILLT